MNTPKLETERLVLRKFTEDDIKPLYILLKDEEVNIFLPWFAVKTLEEAKNFYEETFADNYKRICAYNYAVCLKYDNIPIGYVNINMDDSYDLGYGLRKEFWHKGMITEACKAIVEQLKEDCIPYITATHDVHNPRSGGVMRQIGMKYQYSYEERAQPSRKSEQVSCSFFARNPGEVDQPGKRVTFDTLLAEQECGANSCPDRRKKSIQSRFFIRFSLDNLVYKL